MTLKSTLQITTLLVVAMMIVGCSKSCTRRSEKPETKTEQDGRPNYRGITVQKVVKRELRAGKGEGLKSGQTAIVNYVAWIYDPKKPGNRGAKFEESGNTPASITLGGGEVIRGFDQGLIGLKKGGKRQLIIPPSLAYGDKGLQPHVFPGAIILIEVERN